LSICSMSLWVCSYRRMSTGTVHYCRIAPRHNRTTLSVVRSPDTCLGKGTEEQQWDRPFYSGCCALKGKLPGHCSSRRSHFLCRSRCHREWHCQGDGMRSCHRGSYSKGNQQHSVHLRWRWACSYLMPLQGREEPK
jgi:hypothetical protein